MYTMVINGVTYETDDISLFVAAKHCGPGFAKRIADNTGKIWRKVKE